MEYLHEFNLKYRLEPTSYNQEWDDFIENSVNGTVFSRSQVLKACKGVKVFYISLSGAKAGLVVCETQDSKSIFNHDLLVYSGVIFSQPTTGQKHSQILSERFEISKFLSVELAGMYETVELSLDPMVNDIRPFLWHRYGEDGPHYKVDVRYTTSIDISDFSRSAELNDLGLYLRSSGSRRQEIRYARKKRCSYQYVEGFKKIHRFLLLDYE